MVCRKNVPLFSRMKITLLIAPFQQARGSISSHAQKK